MRTRGRRRKRRRAHRVLDPTYPELSLARATLVNVYLLVDRILDWFLQHFSNIKP